MTDDNKQELTNGQVIIESSNSKKCYNTNCNKQVTNYNEIYCSPCLEFNCTTTFKTKISDMGNGGCRVCGSRINLTFHNKTAEVKCTACVLGDHTPFRVLRQDDDIEKKWIDINKWKYLMTGFVGGIGSLVVFMLSAKATKVPF